MKELKEAGSLPHEGPVDEFAWLQDKADPEVLRHLTRENNSAHAYIAALNGLKNILYEEMISRVREDDEGVPYFSKGYWYYFRIRRGEQYSMLFRRRDDAETEELILDLNALAKQNSYFSLGAISVDDSGDWLAFTVDERGSRDFTLHIRNLRTRSEWEMGITGVASLAWAQDGWLFYTIEDAAKRSCAVYLVHYCGDRVPRLVFTETDPAFAASVECTRDSSLILIYSHSSDTTECRFVPAVSPLTQPAMIWKRRKGVACFIEHRHGRLYMRINDTFPQFRVVSRPLDSAEQGSWNEEIAAREDLAIRNFQVFERFWVATECRQGLLHFRVNNYSTHEQHYIEFPDCAYTVSGYCNADFHANTFRYRYESLTTPRSIFDFDLETGKSTLLKEQTARPHGRYETSRIYFTASDGERIPVSLAFNAEGPPLSERPIYIYAYGAYGHILTVSYSPAHLSLLERGITVAFVHVRGGGEMGERWHRAGMGLAKKRSIQDLIDASESLLGHGYGAKMAWEGGSAGGLLVAAALNACPSLPSVVLLRMPFVDVLNSMLDERLPLATLEYEEWGDPRTKQSYENMMSYSPYENIRSADYPPMLVRASLHDQNVLYWGPAKYVARLRATRSNATPLLLLTNVAGGHGGSSGRYNLWREVADDYAFLLTHLGYGAGDDQASAGGEPDYSH
jgi:oligopeptidase B